MIDSIYGRHMFPVFALAVLLALPAAFAAAEDGTVPETSNLQAGATTSNITPPLGTPLVGSFAPYQAEHVHDELHARCLVLDDGQTRLALVVCDLLVLHRSVSVEARRLIEMETGIPPQNVLISATHTHSAGTALGHNRYANGQELDDYQRFVARRIADGVRRALNLLRPAEIGFARVDVPEQVHNRRWRMREGSVPPQPVRQDRPGKNQPAGPQPQTCRTGRAGRSGDVDRRSFLRMISGAAAVSAFSMPTIIPRSALANGNRPGANDRVRVGCVSAGPRARLLMEQLPESAELVAVADCNLPTAFGFRKEKQADWAVYGSHYPVANS